MTRTTLYDQGSWSCAYRVSPVEEPLSAAQFLNLLQEIEGHLTGWPVWLVLGRQEMRPHLGDGGVIECSLHETSERDFWRADPRGQMYLIRCLQEDTREIGGVQPGTAFDLTLPVWRTGECVLHAHRLAGRLAASQVELQMRWDGLGGRRLAALASPMRGLMPGRTSQQNTIETRLRIDAESIPDALPELVRRLTEPLYAAFDFFQPSTELYSTELDRLRRGV